MSTTRTSSRLGLAGGAVALALALSACGGQAAPPATASTGTPGATAQADVGAAHNDADIRFAQMMIPHHRQAVEMAEIAVDRAENPDVKALAEQIQGAQDPEIETMTGFLEAWGADVPADDGMAGMNGMAGMDHSGMDGMSEMSGMMTPDQMDQMRNATGAGFDTMFLEMMIVHHEGAVADAQRELDEGASPQAKERANQIIAAQTAEIDQMRQMLQAS
jgi:uncharacterized protein (DUF305 family)